MHGGVQGQRVDAKIVEVALFFQAELEAAAAGRNLTEAETATPSASPSVEHLMSVVLLSADNAQLQLARTHGLPAGKLEDLAGLKGVLSHDAPLDASLLRRLLQPTATTGRCCPHWYHLCTPFVRRISYTFDTLLRLQTA